MLLIQNVKTHPGKDGKSFDTFTVGGTFEGWPVQSTGWRYFHESRDIKPPSSRGGGGFWTPTFKGPDALTAAIKHAYQASVLGEALEDYTAVSDAWESFRTLVQEEQEEEALAAFLDLKTLTLEQQIVRLLLEVAVNPLMFDQKDAVALFGGVGRGITK